MADVTRLLIIEDHYTTLDGLVLGLGQQTDFKVVASTASGLEGLTLVEEVKPDLLVLDLHLKGTADPMALLEQFLRYPKLKIIIFSAEARLAYVQAVLAIGVSAYLLKSERVGMIADTIRQVMKGKKDIISPELITTYKKMTSAELEVLHMLGRGMKYQEIADQRCTSIATVRKQCETLVLKLALENREQLIAWAVRNGYGAMESYLVPGAKD